MEGTKTNCVILTMFFSPKYEFIKRKFNKHIDKVRNTFAGVRIIMQIKLIRYQKFHFHIFHGNMQSYKH